MEDKLTREEVLHVANLARIEIDEEENEFETAINQLKAVLIPKPAASPKQEIKSY